ncbi:alpha-amylase family glycosyl hydrolase [Virgibacillus litoralis]|uniref:Alpha-amylase n=1 Tax=Virgibacillus litoralis TaxID=578221 RepID=A0ABS4H8P1_9BACI|nr:alpha-amylase family glycosyl hydrolase [Virgibacillus litoralis]MBP1947276.1 alpha-amylase [Virgibacillus litoralis]
MKHLLVAFIIISFSLGINNPVQAAKKETIHSEIIYNLLVDRFNNGDPAAGEQVNLDDPLAYHGGDLQGVTDKLGTLKELGYTTIVLSPIMENAPGGYHGYWVEDFYKVDDQFGTMADLKNLVKEAHERDIKVVMEFVTNYVSATNPITEDSSKSDWLKENNNVQSYQWLDQAVVLDQSNPEVQEFIMDAADYWIEEANIDGYKFHAADYTNELFLKELTAHINEQNPNFYMLGDILNSEEYTGNIKENTQIDMVENHPLYQPITGTFASAGEPVSTLYDAWVDSGKSEDLTYLDNKYTERFTQKLLKNGRNPLTTWKLALTYLYTAPGTPMIYQGSEIPMGGGAFPDSQEMVQFNSGDEDLSEFINRVAALRSQFPALQKGDYELLGSSGAMSLMKRSYKGETVYIAINNDTESQAVSIDGINSNLQLKGLLGDNLVRENEKGEFKIGLARETAEVYIEQNDTGLNWTFIGTVIGIFLLFVLAVILLSRKQKKREEAEA